MIVSKLTSLENVRILATDIDRGMLSRAEFGLYTEKSLIDVSRNDLHNYFDKEASGYRVKPELKSAVTFSAHNLLADPYLSGVDLIVCRNVLIYFTEKAKEQVHRMFSGSLFSGGYLFVGNTEKMFSKEQYGYESVGNFYYRQR